MPNITYRALSLESVDELLTESVRNMFVAFESEYDYKIAFKPLKKQVEMLIAAIEENKKENVGR